MLPCVSMYVQYLYVALYLHAEGLVSLWHCVHLLGWTEGLASCTQREVGSLVQRGVSPLVHNKVGPLPIRRGSTLLYAEKETLRERSLKTFWVYPQSDNKV
jgi:hypothetical protein